MPSFDGASSRRRGTDIQSFLPAPDYKQSARLLDMRRLNNQVNEGLVIARTLMGKYPPTKTGRPGGWPNHPATRQWKGYERQLLRYCMDCLEIHDQRSLRQPADNRERWERLKALASEVQWTEEPWWLGWEQFHASHRSNLLQKDPEYYAQHNWAEEPGMDYLWPSKHQPEDRYVSS